MKCVPITIYIPHHIDPDVLQLAFLPVEFDFIDVLATNIPSCYLFRIDKGGLFLHLQINKLLSGALDMTSGRRLRITGVDGEL
jgi:hypothetical protein